ncbi:MAG: phosphodiester glycosidase family protein [Lachnospiraceae bacterium]|nr:phosphodiester glycosidase family protein [Lachnospiraceae bacterium]
MKIFKRTILILLTVVLLLLIAIFGAMTVLCKGPSKAAAVRFVNTVMETSALKFIPSIYFPQGKIDEMLAAGEARVPTSTTNVDLINIPAKKAEMPEKDTDDQKNNTSADETAVSQDTAENPDETGISPDENAEDGSDNGILIEELRSETYRGRMMIVEDPSRVYIRMLSSFSESGAGKKVIDMANEDGAIAAMNAGGFYDPDGHGKGGMPLGAVIKEGTLVSNHPSDYNTIIGFDREHRLIVGNMSPQTAIDAGMWEGIAFGPALVINGERVPAGSGGVNPRSAIGQRGDGAVLLLSIDGRQPTSLGATASELEDIMLEYGAVNAANLDGGSSSVLYYEGELISSPSSVVGIRPVPTAILVK